MKFAPLAVNAIKVSADMNARTATGTFFNSTMKFTNGNVSTGKTSDVQSAIGFSVFQSGGELGMTQKIDGGLNPPINYSSYTQYSLFGAHEQLKRIKVIKQQPQIILFTTLALHF